MSDSLVGTPGAIVGAARAVVVGTEVGCLTAGRAAVVDELGVFLHGHVGYQADDALKGVVEVSNAGDVGLFVRVCVCVAPQNGRVVRR